MTYLDFLCVFGESFFRAYIFRLLFLYSNILKGKVERKATIICRSIVEGSRKPQMFSDSVQVDLHGYSIAFLYKTVNLFLKQD